MPDDFPINSQQIVLTTWKTSRSIVWGQTVSLLKLWLFAKIVPQEADIIILGPPEENQQEKDWSIP